MYFRQITIIKVKLTSTVVGEKNGYVVNVKMNALTRKNEIQ